MSTTSQPSTLSEVIYCKCGKMFAACVDGYQDKEWIENRSQLLREGCRFEFVTHEQVRKNFSSCTCPVEVEPETRQLSLFQQ